MLGSFVHLFLGRVDAAWASGAGGGLPVVGCGLLSATGADALVSEGDVSVTGAGAGGWDETAAGGCRNILIGPAFTQWDVSVARNFGIREKMRLQFRAESFNILNHASFTGINTTVRFDAAGRPSQGYGAVTGSGIGRVLEFGMKLIF